MLGDGLFADAETELEEGVGFPCVMTFRRVFSSEDACFGSNRLERKGCAHLRCHTNCNRERCESELVWVTRRADEVFVRTNARTC